MTKEELFKKYNIDESHNVWESIDGWNAVEIYRLLKGKLPENDPSCQYLLDYLTYPINEIHKFHNWGSLYLTAKRAVYLFQELILNELNQPT